MTTKKTDLDPKSANLGKEDAAGASAKKKLCRIISYEKMSPEVRALFESKYPDGYSDYVTRYPKPNGDSFYAVSLYTEEADYLIKVDVDVDLAYNVEDDADEAVNPEDEIGEGMGDERNAPDVNDLADSIADDSSESL